MNGSDRTTKELPSFEEWIVRNHGEEYWRSQFAGVFHAYVSDIYRERQRTYTNNGTRVANNIIAERERALYAIYREEEIEKEGNSRGCSMRPEEEEESGEERSEIGGPEDLLESEDEDEDWMNQESDVEREEVDRSRKETEDGRRASPYHHAMVSKEGTGNRAMVTSGGETEMEVARGEEGEAKEVLEKREGWPQWLRNVMEMLYEGQRGKELEGLLAKLIKIEKSLGFKGEKTVGTGL